MCPIKNGHLTHFDITFNIHGSILNFGTKNHHIVCTYAKSIKNRVLNFKKIVGKSPLWKNPHTHSLHP